MIEQQAVILWGLSDGVSKAARGNPHGERQASGAFDLDTSCAVQGAPGAFENANLDSTGNVRERNSEGEVAVLDGDTGRESAKASGSYLLGVGYTVRQRAYATLQSVFGGKIPALVDGANLRRAGALQSIGQQATPNRHERAGLSHPRQDALAEAGTLRLYSKAADPGQVAGVSVSGARQVAKVCVTTISPVQSLCWLGFGVCRPVDGLLQIAKFCKAR